MKHHTEPPVPWQTPQWGPADNTPTAHPTPTPPPPPPGAAATRRRPRWFMWFFLAVQALFLLWIILGARSGAGTPDDCGTLDSRTCNDAESVGTAIGVGLIIILWAVTDIILGITYAVVRLARRPGGASR